jgi:mannose-6-phosphate isomerase-like protein (cupin superfamily)
MYNRALAEARGFGFEVDEALSSCSRPWGGFLRIKESSYAAFAKAYWNGVEIPTPGDNLRLDPKILLVAPGTRLSLQYHHRRQEHWRVLDGPVVIVRGKDADTLESREYQPGEVIRLACGEWHRLVGANTWGRIAEIWHHVDAANPSDENDIVRVEDDYGR